MVKKTLSKALVILTLVMILGTSVMAANSPKYVFYFIGDGMGASQRQAAEYYLRAKEENEEAKLTMNKFPVAGMNTTHSADSLVTDSAAAGTALSTGYKTSNRTVGQLGSGSYFQIDSCDSCQFYSSYKNKVYV